MKTFHNAGHCLLGLAVFLQVHTLPAASPLLLPGQNGLKEPAGTDKVNVTTSSCGHTLKFNMDLTDFKVS